MKLAEIHEGITLAEPDAAEQSVGWWIVREKDEKGLWGPYTTYAKAVRELEMHPEHKTHGVSNDKIVFIEHGWVDDEYKFQEQDPE